MSVSAPAAPEMLDKLIAWRLHDPRYRKVTHTDSGLHIGAKGSRNMAQRQWYIEARADFADQAKNEIIDQAVREAAVHIHAQLALLMDNGVTPQVICRSDDWFEGEREIGLHSDKLGTALQTHADDGQASQVSDEMLDALRDMKE